MKVTTSATVAMMLAPAVLGQPVASGGGDEAQAEMMEQGPPPHHPGPPPHASKEYGGEEPHGRPPPHHGGEEAYGGPPPHHGEDPLPDTGSTLPQMQRGIKAYKQLKEGKVPEEAYSHMGSFEGMARKYTPESMRAPKEKRSLHARFTEPEPEADAEAEARTAVFDSWLQEAQQLHARSLEAEQLALHQRHEPARAALSKRDTEIEQRLVARDPALASLVVKGGETGLAAIKKYATPENEEKLRQGANSLGKQAYKHIGKFWGHKSPAPVSATHVNPTHMGETLQKTESKLTHAPSFKKQPPPPPPMPEKTPPSAKPQKKTWWGRKKTAAPSPPAAAAAGAEGAAAKEGEAAKAAEGEVAKEGEQAPQKQSFWQKHSGNLMFGGITAASMAPMMFQGGGDKSGGDKGGGDKGGDPNAPKPPPSKAAGGGGGGPPPMPAAKHKRDLDYLDYYDHLVRRNALPEEELRARDADAEPFDDDYVNEAALFARDAYADADADAYADADAEAEAFDDDSRELMARWAEAEAYANPYAEPDAEADPEAWAEPEFDDKYFGEY